MLETVGVQIRTQAEINVKNNTPRAKAEKGKRAVRIAAAENIALAYDNAINVIKNYQGNQGWMNVGFYREKLGQLLDQQMLQLALMQLLNDLKKRNNMQFLG